jgi:hypothetical protein
MYITSNGRIQINYEFKKDLEGSGYSLTEVLTGIFLEILKTTTKSLSQCNQCPGLESDRELRTRPNGSVTFNLLFTVTTQHPWILFTLPVYKRFIDVNMLYISVYKRPSSGNYTLLTHSQITELRVYTYIS